MYHRDKYLIHRLAAARVKDGTLPHVYQGNSLSKNCAHSSRIYNIKQTNIQIHISDKYIYHQIVYTAVNLEKKTNKHNKHFHKVTNDSQQSINLTNLLKAEAKRDRMS